MFNGFFSFDAKFWRTIIPLLTSPGKVSIDYVAGRRSRYSNPFRFYLTVSVFFFLIVGLFLSKKKFDKLSEKNSTEVLDSFIEDSDNSKKEITEKDIDSLKQVVKDELDKSFIPLPESAKNKILEDLEKEAKDTTAIKIAKGNRISFNGSSRLDKFVRYHKKYPDSNTDVALDSLNYEKTFTNRFLYTRAVAANSFVKKDNREKYLSDLLSYGSVSLFIFLPFFTLFLKLFYIRSKYNYVDHLVFVFHTQTVFFMLLTILYLISFFTDLKQAWIFFVLFLVYLIIAMKKFYNQGYFKTFTKFILLNFVYLLLGGIGVVIVGLISFAMY